MGNACNSCKRKGDSKIKKITKTTLLKGRVLRPHTRAQRKEFHQNRTSRHSIDIDAGPDQINSIKKLHLRNENNLEKKNEEITFVRHDTFNQNSPRTQLQLTKNLPSGVFPDLKMISPPRSLAENTAFYKYEIPKLKENSINVPIPNSRENPEDYPATLAYNQNSSHLINSKCIKEQSVKNKRNSATDINCFAEKISCLNKRSQIISFLPPIIIRDSPSSSAIPSSRIDLHPKIPLKSTGKSEFSNSECASTNPSHISPTKSEFDQSLYPKSGQVKMQGSCFNPVKLEDYPRTLALPFNESSNISEQSLELQRRKMKTEDSHICESEKPTREVTLNKQKIKRRNLLKELRNSDSNKKHLIASKALKKNSFRRMNDGGEKTQTTNYSQKQSSALQISQDRLDLSSGLNEMINHSTILGRQTSYIGETIFGRKSVVVEDSSFFRNYPDHFRRKSLEVSLLDTSSVIESTSVIATRDSEGNKYINQYMVLERLGRGSYGVVRLCFDTKLHKKIAMKIMNKKRLKKLFLGRDKTAYKLVENEIAVMKKMLHPNIVQLYEIIDDPNYNKLYLIMQYISGGNLLEKIKLLGKIPEDLSRKWFRELVAGLEYCHEGAGIIHRDIKPENLLLDEAGQLYLSDFGISFMIENGSDESRATLGSSYFMAPEICQGSKYKGRQTDIWAAGVTLYYMLAGELPFKGNNLTTLHQTILNKTPEFPPHWDSDLVGLLKGMLAKIAEDRFTLDQVKINSWVTQKGIHPIVNSLAVRIEVNEEDKSLAICSLKYSMAMARIRSVFKKSLSRARVRIAARKGNKG